MYRIMLRRQPIIVILPLPAAEKLLAYVGLIADGMCTALRVQRVCRCFIIRCVR